MTEYSDISYLDTFEKYKASKNMKNHCKKKQRSINAKKAQQADLENQIQEQQANNDNFPSLPDHLKKAYAESFYETLTQQTPLTPGTTQAFSSPPTRNNKSHSNRDQTVEFEEDSDQASLYARQSFSEQENENENVDNTQNDKVVKSKGLRNDTATVKQKTVSKPLND